MSANLFDQVKPRVEETFFDKQGDIAGSTINHYPKAELNPIQRPTFAESYDAAIQQSILFQLPAKAINSLKTQYEILNGDSIEFDPTSPDYLNQIDSPEYASAYFQARTPGEFYRIQERVKAQEEYRDIEQRTGWLTTALLVPAYALSDPWTFTPISGGKILTSLGKGFLTGAKTSLPGITAAAVGSEATSYALLETRSGEEAVARGFAQIAIGTFLGGASGAIAGKRNEATTKAYQQIFEEGLDGNQVNFSVAPDGSLSGIQIVDDSVSSARTKNVITEHAIYGMGQDEKWNPAKPFLFMSGKILNDPSVRGLSSQSPAVAKFTNEMYEHALDTDQVVKWKQNRTQSVQGKLNDWFSLANRANLEVANGYLEYLGIPQGSPTIRQLKSAFASKQGKLSWKDYNTELLVAITKGENYEGDAFIKRKAAGIHKNYLAAGQNQLEELDVISGNSPFGALNYLGRLADKGYIKANKEELIEKVAGQFALTNEKIAAVRQAEKELESKVQLAKNNYEISKTKEDLQKVKEAEKALKQEQERLQKQIDAKKFDADMVIEVGEKKKLREILSQKQLYDSARNSLDNYLGTSEEQIAQDIVELAKSGANGINGIHRRVMMIDDEWLYRNGILINNAMAAVKSTIIRQGRMIEMTKYLKEQGWNGQGKPFDWLAEQVTQDYKRLENNLFEKHRKERELKPNNQKLKEQHKSESTALQDAKENDINLLRDIYRRLTGTYSKDNAKLIAASRFFQNWGYAVQMGATLFTSVGESVSVAFRAGLFNHITSTVGPFMKRTFYDRKGGAAFKAGLKEQARDLGLGIELESSLFDIGLTLEVEGEVAAGAAGRMAKGASTAMNLVSLSAYTQDRFKNMAVTTLASTYRRWIKRYLDGTLSEYEAIELRNRGLYDKAIATEIDNAFKKHGQKYGGAYLANWTKWNDTPAQIEAKAVFQRAVRNGADSVVFSGSNIASFPQGLDPQGVTRAAFTYMGWMLQANQKYLLPLIQRLDPNRVVGALSIISASMLTDPLRKFASGKEIDDDPAHIVWKGLLNSGIGGLPVDWLNKANATMDLVPELVVDKYNGKGFELFSGIPGSIAMSAKAISNAIKDGTFNKQDLRKMKRIIPLIEAWELRRPVNAFIDALDIPEKPEN